MAAAPTFPGLPTDWTEQLIAVGSELMLRIWCRSKAQTGRALYIVHGFGEQSGRYLHFPQALADSVDVIAAIDLPGHGLSKGQRGHCNKIEEIESAALKGFLFLQNWLREQKRQVKFHWMGHSFGGLITLSTLAKEKNLAIESVIVSAPFLGLALDVPKLKKLFGEWITPILPRFPLGNEISGDKLSRDPRVGESYRQNPLNHSKVTPKMFEQMNLAMKRMDEWAGPLNYSTFLIVPLADEIVSAPKTLELWKKWSASKGKMKEILQLPENRHEAFNDLDQVMVFTKINSWLQSF